jgi:hypothetical protein
MYMCTVLLPSAVNPIAVKYIMYHEKKFHATMQNRIPSEGCLHSHPYKNLKPHTGCLRKRCREEHLWVYLGARERQEGGEKIAL